MKLAGCIILYNPRNEVWDNLNTYLQSLEILYIVDNSEKYNKYLLDKIRKEPKCRYISMKGNKGIATALNRGIGCGLKEGYEWILTMDQDSCFPPKSTAALKEYIDALRDEKVAIVCGRFQESVRKKAAVSHSVTFLCEAITSGSVIRSRIWKKIGGYLEKLFIDEVDNEYCLRLLINGYKIVRVNDALFSHNLGNAEKKHGCITRNYSPFRYYYIVRNNCYVIKTYQKYYLLEEICEAKKKGLWEWVEKVGYEDQRAAKYGNMLKGYVHYKLGIMGKCPTSFWAKLGGGRKE